MVDSFILNVLLLTHLPAPERSSRRLTNGMTDWRQKNSALTTTILFNLSPLPIHFYRFYNAQEYLYTRLGARYGNPPLPSHLATFNLLGSSRVVILKGKSTS
jgi:hypothetical protein